MVAHDGYHLGPSDVPPPPVLLGSAEREPVCLSKPWTNESCGQVVFNGSETNHFFAMPRGARHVRRILNYNRELGRSGSWLPVSHTHTMQHAWQPGLWFYYMRGCSDLQWDMGRTLLVRNRCHLAAILEQRANPGIGWARAIGRVAHKIILAGNVSAWAPDFFGVNHEKALMNDRTAAGPKGMVVDPLEDLLNGSTHWPVLPGRHAPTRSVRDIAEALDTCARGELPAETDKAFYDLVMSLWSLNTLDYMSAAVLYHDLRGTRGQLDTIQIANQCATTVNLTGRSHFGMEICSQPVELWDVRAIATSWRHAAANLSATFSIQPPRPWSDLDGNACELGDSFMYCASCRDSESERSCRYKCSRSPVRGQRYVIASQGAKLGELNYGQEIKADMLSSIRRLGMLGKTEVWRHVWEQVSRRLPTLPREGSNRISPSSTESNKLLHAAMNRSHGDGSPTNHSHGSKHGRGGEHVPARQEGPKTKLA